jgi:hypothetical protein
MATTSPRVDRPSGRARGWLWLAVGLWGALLVGSCVRPAVKQSPGSVGIYRVYAEAGRTWLAGAPLYAKGDDWDVFPYSPLVAVFFAPYSALPDGLGSAVWRITLALAYLLALACWARAALPRPLAPTQRALLPLLVLPVAATTVVAGQAGGLVAAALLLGLAAAARERWNTCAVFVVLACLIKAYPVAVALLLAATYPRRMVPRLLFFGLAALAVPFLFQRAEYVADQYAGWLALMRGSDRHDWPLYIANRNLSLLFRVWLEPLTRHQHLALQLSAAAGVAALCLAGRWADWERRRVLLAILGLSGCWMTLFGPVVESYTYILVGPTLAWMLFEAWEERRPRAYRAVLLASGALFTASTLAVWFPHTIRVHSMGPHPAAGLLLLGCLLADVFGRLRPPPAGTQDQAPVGPAQAA